MNNCRYFSLALNETTDVAGSSKLMILIYGRRFLRSQRIVHNLSVVRRNKNSDIYEAFNSVCPSEVVLTNVLA